MSDPLSEALGLIHARLSARGFIAGGRWALRFHSGPHRLNVHAAVRGSFCLSLGEGEPLSLGEGDVVLSHGATACVLASDAIVVARDAEEVFANEEESLIANGDPVPISHLGGDDVVGIAGHIRLDQSTFLDALPSVTRVRAGALLDQAFHELSHPGPGSDFASERYAQLILLEVLRGNTPSTGWLRILTDAELHPALALMHAEPAHPWRLADLAQAVSMSRSTFATRFRTLSGMPPLTYLHHWRIGLAQAALRESDATVAALAARFGYASESSFSHAFTRTAGLSPRHYRELYR
jgi:AraC-like DNA-binding protein